MNVFISWSGEPSKQVAELLREWLPDVIQVVKPWVSAKDVDKGASWFDAIATAIQDAEGFGIFCVTPESVAAPWLLFEAGAIGMRDSGRVATFLHGLTPSELRPPLGLFQATIGSSRDDVRALLMSVNQRLATPLAERQLDRAIDTNWARLAEGLSKISPTGGSSVPKKADPVALLEEILSTVRRLDADRGRSHIDFESFLTNPVYPSSGIGGLLGTPPVDLRPVQETPRAGGEGQNNPESAGNKEAMLRRRAKLVEALRKQSENKGAPS